MANHESSSALAFQDDFTQSHDGRCFFVSVEPQFDEQINEAATLIARSTYPSSSSSAESIESQRTQLVEKLTSLARQAVPAAQPASADAENDEATPAAMAQDTEQTRAAKRDVLSEVLRSTQAIRLDALDREFDGFSNLLLSLILSLRSDSDSTAFEANILSLIKAISFSQSSTAHPTLSTRYNNVSIVFNALPLESTFHKLRLTVLLDLIEFASRNDDMLIVEPAIIKFESYLLEWGFPPGTQEADSAVLQIVKALQKAEATVGTARFAQVAKKLLIDHLTPSSNSTSTTSELTSEIASELIALSLRLSNEYDFSTLATLPALSSPSVPLLGELLETFKSGNVASLDSILSKSDSSSILSSHGLDPSKLRQKLQLLSLTELCSSRVGSDVSYSELAESLALITSSSSNSNTEEIDEQVENWVISAIRAGLISGRLQGSQSTLRITRANPRTFNSNHWKVLEQRLGGWRSSLDAILDSVRKGVSVGAGTGAGAKGEGGAIELNGQQGIDAPKEGIAA